MARVDHGAILEALREGESQNAVARRLGYSTSTVNRVARLNGIEWHSPEKRPDAAATYSLERRLALLDKVFARAEALVDAASTPHQLQSLAIALGVLIDKRRLEDGDVTQRTEVGGGGARERLAQKLDELAARRAATAAS